MNDARLYPVTLYYDATCPMCDAEMANLRRLDSGGRLRFVDASAPDFAALPPGVTRADLMRLLHAQRADGQVISGVAAFRLAYGAIGLNGVARLLDMPVIARVAERVYPWVARHRYRFPAWTGRLAVAAAARLGARRAAQRICTVDGSCRD